MHFLAAREETGCTTGCLLEADSSGSKIDERVAVLFRGIIEIDEISGSTGASGHWVNKLPSGKGLVGVSGCG